MPRRIPIQLPPGLRKDDTSYSTQGAYRDGVNMRFVQDRAEVIHGWENVSEEFVPGVVRNMLQWRDKIQAPLIALGSNSHLYIWRSGTLYDITPPEYLAGSVNGGLAPGYGLGGYGLGPYGIYLGDGAYVVKTWSLDNYGQALIATPRLGPMYYWGNDTSNAAVEIASLAAPENHVPAVVNLTLITPYNQVMALGCSEEYDLDANGNAVVGGIYNPLNIRCSDIEDYTQWAVSRENNCFENPLPFGGSIRAARNWGQQVGVWTETDLFVGTFTGDPSAIYRFDPVPGGVGAVGPNAVEIIGSVAYWISPDFQLWACSFGGTPDMIECPIWDTTLSQISPSQRDKVILTHLTAYGELRIDYPNALYGQENNRSVSLHLKSGAWSAGDVGRSAFCKGEQFPLGAEFFEQNMASLVEIVDNESAALALTQAQQGDPSIGGTNLVRRANTAVSELAAVQDITYSDSQWGFVMVGNANTVIYGEVNDLNINANAPVTVSFDAKIFDGAPEVSGEVEIYHTANGHTSVSTTGFVMTRDLQHFTVENVTMPTNASNTTVRIGVASPVLGNDVSLNVTNIKVEQTFAATGWTPAPNDTNLYALYADFIRQLKYDQTISKFYYHERGTTANGGPITWFIETNDFAIDENYTSQLLTRFIPDFIGQVGPINVTMYFRMNPQDTEEIVRGPFTLVPGEDRIDFMEQAKIVRFKFSGSAINTACRFGRSMFEATPTGTR